MILILTFKDHIDPGQTLLLEICGLSRQVVSHGSGLSRQVSLYQVINMINAGKRGWSEHIVSYLYTDIPTTTYSVPGGSHILDTWSITGESMQVVPLV